MAHYFVVAFGSGVGAPLTIPPEEAAEELRFLIDKALAAHDWSAAQDLIVSVAPNGVMLAVPDQTPERAIRLAEAVQAQLQHAERRGGPVIPVAAVIMLGPMRSVSVLGYSSNFEGRPAIAAARILARLESGLLAVDESASPFPTLARDLAEPEERTGKHPGETFSTRVHRKIRFPLPAGVSSGPPRPTAELRFRIAFASEQKEQWRIEAAGAPARVVDVPWKEDKAFAIALNEFFELTGRPVVEERDHQALSAHSTRLGEGLTRVLLVEEDLEVIRRASPEGPPPLLTIESDDSLILALPWELLRIDGAFAVREARIDLVRTVTARPASPPTLAPPDRYLRLLVLVSAPEGSRLDYEAESYRITRALHDHSEIVHAELGTVDDLLSGIVKH